MGRHLDPLDTQSHVETEGRPQIARARVTRAPESDSDALLAGLAGFPSSQSYEVVGGHWAPRGLALPAEGDECVVTFDHLGDAWVAMWVGATDIPLPPVPVGGLLDYAGRGDPADSRFLLADGRPISRADHPECFGVLCPRLGAVTINLAAPGVLSLSGHGLQSGDKIYLTTTGALPAGLAPNTLYYVNRVGVDTFNVATSLASLLAGAYVATSTSQSGVHTLVSCPYGLGDGATTFGLPDYRGRGSRAPDLMANPSPTVGTERPAAGRVALGAGQTGAAVDNTLGGVYGEAAHVITVGEQPSHTHAVALTSSDTSVRHHHHATGWATSTADLSHTHEVVGDSQDTNTDHVHFVSGSSQDTDTNHQHHVAGDTWNADPYHTHSIGYSFVGLSTGSMNIARPDSTNPNTYPTGGTSINHSHHLDFYSDYMDRNWSHHHTISFNSQGMSANAAHHHHMDFNSQGMSANATHGHTVGGDTAGMVMDSGDTDPHHHAVNGNTNATGGGAAHNNLAPEVVMNKIIRVT